MINPGLIPTVIAEGCVTRRMTGSATAVACGPRCAVTSSGRIVCTFMGQSALGQNDFQPMLAESMDGGSSWSEARPLWPAIVERESVFGSISRSPARELFFYGSRTPIDTPGEAFWCDATQGLKQNVLFWTRSRNDGRSWEPFSAIPISGAGSAEAPGPLCATRGGAWVACYAPYNTFNPRELVVTNRVVSVYSNDQGRTWESSAMLQFAEASSKGAEAWVIELSDGRLLGTGWHIPAEGSRPNAYAISHDGGRRWSETRSTGTPGQSTSLAALPGARALFVYNQRKGEEIGIWLAVASPTDADFNLESNQRVWAAENGTQTKTSGDHAEWTDFAFGEPSPVILPDGTVLVVFWCRQTDGYAIRYVKLSLPSR